METDLIRSPFTFFFRKNPIDLISIRIAFILFFNCFKFQKHNGILAQHIPFEDTRIGLIVNFLQLPKNSVFFRKSLKSQKSIIYL